MTSFAVVVVVGGDGDGDEAVVNVKARHCRLDGRQVELSSDVGKLYCRSMSQGEGLPPCHARFARANRPGGRRLDFESART